MLVNCMRPLLPQEMTFCADGIGRDFVLDAARASQIRKAKRGGRRYLGRGPALHVGPGDRNPGSRCADAIVSNDGLQHASLDLSTSK